MNFDADSLPSAKGEAEWHWKYSIQDKIDLSNIKINESTVTFCLPADYFELSDMIADKISAIGRKYSFFSQEVYLSEVELRIFGNIHVNTQVGALLNNIKHFRPTAEVYGLLAKFLYIDKSVFCGIKVCFVDNDTGNELDVGVFEIGEDEKAYVLPIAISEESLAYYSLDDMAKLAYWLGNFWVGVQYELNNCLEEIRIVEERGSITVNQGAESRSDNRLILIKRINPVDKEGNEIKYCATGSGRQFKLSAWGVRGHNRTLADGRIVSVRPYRKGKDRKDPVMLATKEYRFVEEKIDTDIEG